MPSTLRRTAPRGFTLVELLVVIAIIGLISAVALPVVLPALNERRVSEAARILQAVLAGTRDAAIRANAPRGIRLLPDPVFGFIAGQPFASNRFIAIEPAPDYSEGVVRSPERTYPAPAAPNTTDPTFDPSGFYLRIAESGHSPVPASTLVPTGIVLNSPTGWRYNIRQGDKIRFNDSGAYYTIAGPINGPPYTTVNGKSMTQNPERYITYPTAVTSTGANYLAAGWIPEFLNLTNGIDDDGDGWIDESCDGIDNDGDGVIDPGFNGIDDDGANGIDDPAELFYSTITGSNEYEQEVFAGVQSSTNLTNENYTILRRPVVSPNAAEVTLPAGTVIDLTTWNAASSHNGTTATPTLPERSRLPVDPFSGYVDVLIDQTGRVVPPGAGSGGGGYYANSPIASLPFYHFWITEREAVVAPLWDPAVVATPYAPAPNPNYSSTPPQYHLLPMPQGTPNYTNANFLKGERRLVTLFTRTGQIVANSIEAFDGSDTSNPFYDAQSGTKESQ